MKLKIDLHVHTSFSKCALLSPDTLAHHAARRGLDGVAVTDHNTMQGVRAVEKGVPNIKIIPGEEIRTSHGEITGYFLKDEIPPGLSPEETIAAIRSQGGLVSVPHPFDRLRTSRIEPEALKSIITDIDMLEIFNARDVLIRQDHGLLKTAREAGVVPVVGSDAHLPLEMGRAYIEIDDFTTPREFLHNLKSCRMVSRKSPFWVHIITKILKAYRRNQPATHP